MLNPLNRQNRISSIAAGNQQQFEDVTIISTIGNETENHSCSNSKCRGFFATEYKIILEQGTAILVAIDEQRRRWRRQRRRPSLAIPKLSRRINADYQPSVLSSERTERRRWWRSAPRRSPRYARVCAPFTRTTTVPVSASREIARSFASVVSVAPLMLDTMLPNVNAATAVGRWNDAKCRETCRH